ncbi:hypothetical protein ACJJTC_018732 [Scirpophaga incertulas]
MDTRSMRAVRARTLIWSFGPGVGAFALRWQALRSGGAAHMRRVRARRTCAAHGARPGTARGVAAGLEPPAFCALFDEWREHERAADANIAVVRRRAPRALPTAWRDLPRFGLPARLWPVSLPERRPWNVDPAPVEGTSPPHFLVVPLSPLAYPAGRPSPIAPPRDLPDLVVPPAGGPLGLGQGWNGSLEFLDLVRTPGCLGPCRLT